MAKSKWIQAALKKSKKGSLRKALGAKKGQKIPLKKLKSASKKGGKLGQRARMALTLRKFQGKKLKGKGYSSVKGYRSKRYRPVHARPVPVQRGAGMFHDWTPVQQRGGGFFDDFGKGFMQGTDFALKVAPTVIPLMV